jgi:hypothetical protein
VTTFSKSSISKYEVEKKAHDLGMMYPDELKAFFNNNK